MVHHSLPSECQRLILLSLLCVLHCLVKCHERASRLAEAALAALKRICVSLHLLKDHKLAVRRRGSPPAFPRIVAIVLTEAWGGAETLDNLTTLLYWTSAAGIQSVQVYQAGGDLKARAKDLGCRLNFHKELYNVQVWKTHQQDSTQLRKGALTGPPSVLGQKQIQVILLSQEDGRRPVLQAIKTGASQSRLQDVKSKDSFMEWMSAANGAHVIEQPNLVWVVGPVFTLAGFPPWLVRQSEIHNLGCLAKIWQEDIDNALQKYCHTSQRFGK